MFSSPGAIAFQIGPVVIRWYGILMATAIVVGLWLGHRRAKREGLPADDIISCGQWAILAGLVAAPSMALGQAIGRWGNFFNEEAFGRPTDLPWKLYISPPHRPLGFGQYDYFHPTFLYESLWDLLVFGLLLAMLRPRIGDRPGALFFSYVGLYSAGRFAIEAIRLDSFWLGPWRVAQLASVLGVAVAVAGVVWASRRSSSLAAS